MWEQWSGWLIITCGLCITCWIGASYYAMAYLNQRHGLMVQVGLKGKKREKKKTSLSQRLRKWFFEWGEKFAPLGQRFPYIVDKDQLERQITLAGAPEGLNVPTFMGMCFLMVVLGLLLSNLLLYLGVPLANLLVLLSLAGGFLGPWFWLKNLARKRQEEIGLDLPDFMDGMAVTLAAGVPLDAALKQVSTQMEGPLAEELGRFIQEVELGVPREQSYQRLAERNDCPSLDMLVNSLIQGGKLGVPIGNTFQILARDLRQSRINRLKEKAAKAGPKITLVTTFVILPGVLIGIFGLIVLNIIYNADSLGIGILTQ